jgi:DNA-binding SARP family transcriptional activator
MHTMLQFRILGPLEVAHESGLVDLGGDQQRSVLAMLLVRVNEVVATESFLEALWDGEPPRHAVASLQNRISGLRKALGPELIETRPPGYRLRIEPEQLDALQFERLVQQAEGQPAEERAATLTQALALWRGDPLADMTFKAFAQEEIRRLNALRLRARSDLAGTQLERGRHAEVVAELESLVSANPLDEAIARQLMLALYRCGRQREALDVYYTARDALVDELGQDPGLELQATHLAILRHQIPKAPPVKRRRSMDQHYEEIVRAALMSQLIPVLGPHVGSPDMALDPRAAARHLAARFTCPPEYDGSLTRVGQWVAVTQGVGPLFDELRTLYAHDFAPGPVHRSLAALAPLLRARGLGFPLILTCGFDHLLEQAYSEVGEPYDVVSFVSFGRDRGKFLHIADGGETRLIDEPNREVDLSSGTRTLIVRLNGGGGELSDRVRDTYVVSEDDYIDYLSQSEVSALLPVGLAAQLRRSHLLFVGYDLEDWNPRVFLRRLWGEERINYKSWAIAESPTQLTAAQWQQLGVDALDVPSDESLEELHRRVAGELADGGMP